MRAIATIFRTVLLEAWARRGAFFFELGVMVLNNTVWIFFWLIFFHNVGNIRSWTAPRTLELFSVLCTVFGISNGFFKNARHLGQLAAQGELDSALTLPINPLAYLLIRRISAYSIGDLVFGVLLFVLIGHPTPIRALIFALVVILGAIVFTSFLVLLSSATIAVGEQGELAQIGFEAVGLLGFYPLDYFGGWTKFLMFTLLPVAFVCAMPADIVTHFSWPELAVLVLVAVGLAVSARIAFNAALRRYHSGSKWTTG